MILLSEVAEKIRNEFDSWPGNARTASRFSCAPSVQDARQGDERQLSEVLGILLGLFSAGQNPVEMLIGGNEKEIVVSLLGEAGHLAENTPDWHSLRKKAAEWTPRLSVTGERLDLKLNIPASAADPPVDLAAVAGETGLSLADATMVLEGFLKTGRNHLEVLDRSNPNTGDEERFRAAHSLKGAGKTLRAAELAAAARQVEQQLKENRRSEPDLTFLKASWFRIEKWHKETVR